jgi:hypothetical protein
MLARFGALLDVLTQGGGPTNLAGRLDYWSAVDLNVLPLGTWGLRSCSRDFSDSSWFHAFAQGSYHAASLALLLAAPLFLPSHGTAAHSCSWPCWLQLPG